METYCVSCKKHTANKKSSVRKTNKNRLILSSNKKCVLCVARIHLLKIKNTILIISLK